MNALDARAVAMEHRLNDKKFLLNDILKHVKDASEAGKFTIHYPGPINHQTKLDLINKGYKVREPEGDIITFDHKIIISW